MSEEELQNDLAEATEKIARLQRELERAEKRLKRLQSGLIWSSWIAVLAVIAFFLGRTLFPDRSEPAAPATEPVVEAEPIPSKQPQIPVYNPPPSVSQPQEAPEPAPSSQEPPPAMPGFK